MIIIVFKTLLVLVIAAFLAGFLRTLQIEHGTQAEAFRKGTAPNPPLDGLYAGTVPGYSTSWLGKKFDEKNALGINKFSEGSITAEKYPFKTSVGTGVRIASDVLKIDYNLPENPFWLRAVLDEVVQTGPGKYLGKLELRIVPGYPFSILYFELENKTI